MIDSDDPGETVLEVTASCFSMKLTGEHGSVPIKTGDLISLPGDVDVWLGVKLPANARLAWVVNGSGYTTLLIECDRES